MSKREDIAGDIVTKLTAVSSPIAFKKITRTPFDPQELADPQFPAVFIQTSDETREDSAMGSNTTGKKQGTIDFVIVGFVKGADANIDTKRNQLIEVVEETLDNDITRNGNAIDTQIVECSSDDGVLYPIGGVRIVARVLYDFVRGNA